MSVLVYTENWEGKFKKLSYELVSYAAAMAEMLNTSLTALSIGEVDSAELESLGRFGASKIVSIENEKLKNLDNQAYTAVIADMAKKLGARVIILANNNTGKAVAPRLSVKLKAGVGAGVSRLPSSLEPFTVYKRVYSGNAYAHIVIKTEVRILTLAQNSFDIAEGDNKPEIEKLSYDLDPALVKTEVRDVNKQS